MKLRDGAIPDQKLRRARTALWRGSIDSVVVVSLVDAADPIVLTGTGCTVWSLLATPLAVDELVDTLATTYAADRTTVRSDIEPLLHDLIERHLVESDAP